MQITKTLSDDAVLVEIGERITQRRIDMQFTQAEVAERAGLAKRTLERIEAGASAQMASVVKIFRVLDLMPGLDSLIPQVEVRPMALLKQKSKVRQRASKPRVANKIKKPWSWNEPS